MKHAILLITFAIFVLPNHAEVRDEPPGISIIGSSRETLPDLHRVTRAVDLAQAALGRRHLPHIHIVLMYVDKEVGRTQGIAPKSPVRVVHLMNSKPETYHVFIVGGANDDRLAWAMVAVLERQWGLNLDKKQIDEVAHRVRLELSGVVSASELAAPD